MKQIFGLLKFGASLIIFPACIVSFINVAKKYDIVISILAITIVALVFGVYVYYLIQTGIWNFKNRIYTRNVFLLIGLLLQFIFTISALYYSTLLTRNLLITTIPFAVVGIIIGSYDFMQFYETWKRNKLEMH